MKLKLDLHTHLWEATNYASPNRDIVARILFFDADLRSRVASFLTRMMPAYRSLLAQGQDLDESPRITPEAIQEAESLLGDLLKQSSPSLKADLLDAWREVGLDQAAGMTFQALWQQLQPGHPSPASPGDGDLEYKVAARSLVIPADSSNSLTVGATYWKDDKLESYSSQGPTKDGRTKPDISAPTRVCTRSYGDCGGSAFNGTSAATPHVSGVAALVKSAFPLYGPAQLQSYLEGQALDLGAAGKDNLYGSGRLRLPTLLVTPSPSPTPTRTPTPTATPTPSSSASTPTPTPTLTPTAIPTPTPTPSPITLPDLYALPDDIWTNPTTVRQGDKVGLGVTVRNRGGAAAGKVGATVKVDFFDGSPSSGGKRLGSGTVPIVSPFGLAAVRMSETWDTLGVVGARDVYAVVDPANEIGESGEDNNTAFRAVQVLPPAADTLPPRGTISINGGAPSTAYRQVTLSLEAQDEGGSGVQHMHISEVTFDSVPKQWISAQDSGWKPYSRTYPWSLTAGEGAKYLRVWFADGAGNIATVPAKGMTNYLPPSGSLAAGEWALYRQAFEIGTVVTVTLTTTTGDADLFAWLPGNARSPDYYSINSGTTSDVIAFAAPISGTYQIQVHGFEASTYTLSVATGGAFAASHATDTSTYAGMGVLASKTIPAAPLSISEPATEQGVAPVGYVIYLPFASRSLTAGW